MSDSGVLVVILIIILLIVLFFLWKMHDRIKTLEMQLHPGTTPPSLTEEVLNAIKPSNQNEGESALDSLKGLGSKLGFSSV